MVSFLFKFKQTQKITNYIVMRHATIIGIYLLLTSYTFSQEEYKIGVNLFREETGSVATQQITGKTLDSIVASITANQPNRIGKNKHVKLVISLDVSWEKTEIKPGVYNFEWYKSFAKLCEQKNISWTPLLAPHYVPNFILQNPKYANHQVNYVDGTPLNEFNFLPISPSSPIWDNEVALWIKAFIDAMAQANHFTIESSNPKAIDEILIGNEMMYSFNKETSGDSATKAKWMKDGHSIDDYPTSRKEFLENWNSIVSGKPNLLRDFRNKELGNCIAGMMQVVKSQLALRLGSINANTIGVSSKLFPYQFPRAEFDTFFINEFSGYDEQNLQHLIATSNKFIAVDSYSTSTGWKITNDYQATYDRISTSGKSIYLSEFNRNLIHEDIPLTTTDIYNYGMIGFKNYNLKYYVYFAWNPKSVGAIYQITEGQKLGLYNLFNTLVPIENPKESVIKNNFASGAYTIDANYNNSTDFSIFDQDVDWYKFSYDQRVYYLKVVKKPSRSHEVIPKKYGLQLTTNLFAIQAKTYETEDGPIDTQLFLYNENLEILTQNDNRINSTFSKISYPLLDFPFIPFKKNTIRKL